MLRSDFLEFMRSSFKYRNTKYTVTPANIKMGISRHNIDKGMFHETIILCSLTIDTCKLSCLYLPVYIHLPSKRQHATIRT
jgi:hypothetical protein